MSSLSRFTLRPVLFALPLALLAPFAGAQVKPATVSALPTPQEVRDVMALTDWTLQSIAVPEQAGAPFHMALALDGMPVALTLVPHSVLAPGFKLMAQVADGSLREEVPAAPNTYQGHVDGFSDSIVAGSLVDGQFSGVLRLAHGETLWGVQPATQVDAQAARDSYIVYDSRNVDLPGFTCGTDDTALRGLGVSPTGPAAKAAGDKVAQIACDADFEFFNLNGASTTNTQNDITNIINGVQAIYHNDVGILYTITQIIVRTAEPDPYSSTSPKTLLNQFSSDWNTNHGSIPRDLAHLFTGKNIDGSVIGIAQLSVVCNVGAAYGLVQSKFTGSLTVRYALSAHEIGHNWSATHCDGDPLCSIMCSGIGGCSGNITSFNPGSKTQILNKKNSVTCLSDPIPPSPPVISNVSPNPVKVLGGTAMTIDGTFFTSANQVTHGGQVVPFTLVSDNQITYFAPVGNALGNTGVVVTTEGGTSNTKTITTVETSPPQLQAPVLAFSFFPYTWTFGGGANKFASLIVGLTNTTFVYQAQNILLFDFIVQQAPLDALGLGSASIAIPASALGITFYSQMVTVTGGIVAASNITAALIGG